MAMSALRPCAHFGCGELVREGRCPKHSTEVRQREEAKRASRQERGYGPRWEASRKGYLARHTRCVLCNERATVVDHIVPHNGNWDLFWAFKDKPGQPANVRALCATCHNKKTATSDGRWGMLSMKPPFPQPLARPLTVIAGPPGAGKTLFVSRQAKPGELVVDLDVIKAELSGLPLYGAEHEEWRERAMRERNKRLVGLCYPDCRYPAAWLISSLPLASDRRWWKDLGARVFLLRPTVEKTLANLAMDKRRSEARRAEHMRVAVDWYKKHTLDPFHDLVLEDAMSGPA
jgi:5-methylcytosine-specific restriction endonuclease McrA